jgi:hypothetical protein
MTVSDKRYVNPLHKVAIEQAIANGLPREQIMRELHVPGYEIDAIWHEMNLMVKPNERQADWTEA